MSSGDGEESEFDSLLRSKFGKATRDTFDRHLVEQVSAFEQVFDDNRRRQEDHDRLIDVCLTAFGPKSEAAARLGYNAITSEPLKELDVPCFDCMVYSSKRKHGIFVECKSSIAEPGVAIRDACAAIARLESHVIDLEDGIGDSLRSAEYVMCVPAESCQALVKYLQKHESGTEVPKGADRLLVWQVDQLNRQTLQHWTLDWRPRGAGHHQDPDLVHHLLDHGGVRTDGYPRVNPRVYPGSHPLRIAKEILAESITRASRSGAPLDRISIGEMLTHLASPSTLFHYAAPRIARGLFSSFQAKGVGYRLLTKEDPDTLVLNVKGKSANTLLTAYERGFRRADVERAASVRARGLAVAEIRSQYPDLTGFDRIQSA